MFSKTLNNGRVQKYCVRGMRKASWHNMVNCSECEMDSFRQNPPKVVMSEEQAELAVQAFREMGKKSIIEFHYGIAS